MLKIREERKEDYQEVYGLVKRAFETAEHADGTEQDLVVRLRKSQAFIPKLALVAEIEEKIVGYLLFTKVKIGEKEEIGLAPLAVLPKYQKQGIGSKLIAQGHKIAKDLGYHYSIVVGSEHYYPKFGYVQASHYEIKAPFEIEDKNFMALRLKEDQVAIKGIVQYAKEFNIS